jgi:hypothetical protein
MYRERSAEINVRGEEGIGGVGGFATPFGCAASGVCVDLRSGCFRRPATVGEAGVAAGANCEDRAAWIVAYGSAC